jgi:hypothetical protein
LGQFAAPYQARDKTFELEQRPRGPFLPRRIVKAMLRLSPTKRRPDQLAGPRHAAIESSSQWNGVYSKTEILFGTPR